MVYYDNLFQKELEQVAQLKDPASSAKSTLTPNDVEFLEEHIWDILENLDSPWLSTAKRLEYNTRFDQVETNWDFEYFPDKWGDYSRTQKIVAITAVSSVVTGSLSGGVTANHVRPGIITASFGFVAGLFMSAICYLFLCQVGKKLNELIIFSELKAAVEKNYLTSKARSM